MKPGLLQGRGVMLNGICKLVFEQCGDFHGILKSIKMSFFNMDIFPYRLCTRFSEKSNHCLDSVSYLVLCSYPYCLNDATLIP